MALSFGYYSWWIQEHREDLDWFPIIHLAFSKETGAEDLNGRSGSFVAFGLLGFWVEIGLVNNY